jgi:hypothetical protein
LPRQAGFAVGAVHRLPTRALHLPTPKGSKNTARGETPRNAETVKKETSRWLKYPGVSGGGPCLPRQAPRGALRGGFGRGGASVPTTRLNAGSNSQNWLVTPPWRPYCEAQNGNAPGTGSGHSGSMLVVR